jgi:hypothetical protein
MDRATRYVNWNRGLSCGLLDAAFKKVLELACTVVAVGTIAIFNRLLNIDPCMRNLPFSYCNFLSIQWDPFCFLLDIIQYQQHPDRLQNNIQYPILPLPLTKI